jgi:acyl-CoA reductase-like NAD-dependent aldehyde dehydrogenase
VRLPSRSPDGGRIADATACALSRPIRYTASEVGSTLDRAKHLIAIAESALASVPVEEKAGFKRYLKKEALGVVAVVSPWK